MTALRATWARDARDPLAASLASSFALHADAPVVNITKLYGPGGMGYSAEVEAFTKLITLGGKLFPVRKFKFVRMGSDAVNVTLKMNFTQHSALTGVFGGGAIVDPDTNTLSAANLSFTLNGTDVTPTFIQDGATVDSSTLNPTQVFFANFSVSIAGENTVGVKMWGAASATFNIYFDLLERACPFASNFTLDAATQYADLTLCSDAEVSNATATTVDASAGASQSVLGFETLASQFAAVVTNTDTPLEARIEAAEAARSAARGAYQVSMPPNAFTTASGTLPLSAAPVTTTAAAILPVQESEGEVTDAAAAVK
ncbi:MAG: hypothetical protein EOO65_02230, partial [Methanosarcinales archaeon]